MTRVVDAPQWVMWEHGDKVTPGQTLTYNTGHGLVTKSVLTIDQVMMNMMNKRKLCLGNGKFAELCMPRHGCKQHS